MRAQTGVLVLALVLTATGDPQAARAKIGFSRVTIKLQESLAPSQRAHAFTTAQIITRQITTRCNAAVTIYNSSTHDEQPASTVTLVLQIDAAIGDEGFTVIDGDAETITITGGDARGLLYGAGKWLRSSRFDGDRDRDGDDTPTTAPFLPGSWRGADAPRLRNGFRAHYLAVHYNNYYQEASDNTVAPFVPRICSRTPMG